MVGSSLDLVRFVGFSNLDIAGVDFNFKYEKTTGADSVIDIL